MASLSFVLNGIEQRLQVDEERPLLWVLRDDLGLTGTKYGCGVASCGACTVLVDGKAVRACVTSMKSVEGKRVTTIEGIADGDKLSAVQQAFVEHLGFQCGFCTPGMIVGGHALLLKNPRPSRAEIKDGLEGHLCRCGAYNRIVAAIETAAKRGGK